MSSVTEASLLASLESSDCKGLYQQISTFLGPLRDLMSLDDEEEYEDDDHHNRKKNKTTNKKKKEIDPKLMRSLAKQFLPFLSRLLKLLPNLLNESAKRGSGEDEDKNALEFFKIYRFSLDCLSCISPCLAGKPYSVDLQWIRLVRCLEAWERYGDAEREGFSILERLRSNSKTQKGKRAEGLCFLPKPMAENADPELVVLLVEIVVSLIACSFKSRTKDGAVYRRVLALFHEVGPWLRILDSEAFEKYHRVLVSTLYKCALFVVAESLCFDGNLVHDFCMKTLKECLKSSLKDHFPKFAHKICSSINLQCVSRPVLILDLLRCTLEYLAHECKASVVYTINEFLDFVHYCANSCRIASTEICKAAAKHFTEMANDLLQVLTPIAAILQLYAVGLYFTDSDAQSGHTNPISGSSKAVTFNTFLLENEESLQHLSDLLCSIASCFHNAINENEVYSSHTEENSRDVSRQGLKSNPEFSNTCKLMLKEAFLLSYLNALEFFCKPIAVYVNTAWKLTVYEEEAVCHSSSINYAQDAFHHFCDTFFFGLCNKSEKERERLLETRSALLHVAIASIRMSLATGVNTKKNVDCIGRIISREWIQPLDLKFLVSSLYNIGVSWYNTKQLEKASVAFELCCRASWTHVSLVCHTFSYKSEGIDDDNSTEDAIIDIVTDSCSKSTILLDVLHQCRKDSINEIIVNSLLNWSVAGKLLKNLSGPMVLVKQWVKIICKDFGDLEPEDNVPNLYSLLSKSCAMCTKTMGLILEQELLAYAEMEARYPNICQMVQFKIIDILLLDVYVTKDYYLQRSKVLVRKGRAVRACGIEGLNSCIQCLTEAIFLLESISGGTSRNDAAWHHQLALTYCLHALCTQEADQNSKVILHDIDCALKLWSSINILGHWSPDDYCGLVTENAIMLLYHIADLLSLKGYVDIQYDIYKLIIMFYKRKNVPLEKCLVVLWADRRLHHALCTSPIDKGFILDLSQQFGVHSNSIDFWISCIKDFPQILLGFHQKILLSDSILPQEGKDHFESSFSPDITVDEIRKAASVLISNVPVASPSAFLAGYLYYDLSERLFLNGRLFEALSYARDSLLIRTKLLKRKFTYSVGEQSTKDMGTVEATQQNQYSHTHLEAVGSVITEVWPDITKSQNLEDSILSPWNVLKCYLESALQVGIIHESIGNWAEAEALLLVGKTISRLQDLPIFRVVFATSLGKLYRKKQLWNMAENELDNAKKILADSHPIISCKPCRFTLEVTVDLQLGDLIRSHCDSTARAQSIESCSRALDLYRSALEKLYLPELDNNLSFCAKTNTESVMFSKTLPDKADYGAAKLAEVQSSRSRVRSLVCGNCAPSKCNASVHFGGLNQSDAEKLCTMNIQGERSQVNIEAKTSKKSKVASKCLPLDPVLKSEHSRRVRSTCRSSRNKNAQVEGGLDNEFPKYSSCINDIPCPGTQRQIKPQIDLKSNLTDFGCDEACLCNRTNCWRCLLMKVMGGGSMQDIIYMKWECQRRHLSLRLLAKIGQCTGVRGEIHKMHEIFLQSISVLFCRKPFSQAYSVLPHSLLLEFIEKENPGDIFAIERAVILYTISWFSVKSCVSEQPRIKCCKFADIQISTSVTWLLQAFILCRELPLLFQKVARLLASIFLLSTSGGHFSLPLYTGKALSASHWAAYFHQASLGTNLHHQYQSGVRAKLKDFNFISIEGSQISRSTNTVMEACDFFRYAPAKLEDFEGFVTEYFQSLPSVTIVCISLLGGSYSSLLGEMLLLPSSFPAWMLLSRLDSKRQPVVMFLPVDLVLEETQHDDDDDDDDSGMELVSESESSKRWECPWQCTVVDDLAPQFKLILEENYLSSSSLTPADTQRGRLIWWTWRTRLNNRLDKFLRSLEDSWLGPWRCLLLGELSDCRRLDTVLKKLIHDLKCKCKFEAHENLLRVILGGSKSVVESEACISQMLLYEGYFGRGGCCGEERCGAFSATCEGNEIACRLPHQMMLEAISELGEEHVNREPIILVLDADVQMLPWENLPILREHEVYRMPSVGSISATLNRSCYHQEQVGGVAATFPSIDPLDAYYLLNPSGDLSSTQVEFEQWFKNQKLEGKAGNVPPTEELALALQNHDLFLYFGHGSGIQYISGHQIQKLERCAATLLMGCSSGSLFLKGCYAPQGAPLHYLSAGSPAIIANLWDVTDKDIDRFSKAMLNSWFPEEITPQGNCARCSRVVEEFRGMNVSEKGRNAKRKVPRGRKLPEDFSGGKCKNCAGRMRIASFISRSRNACNLPLLIGASPVCYGVPTIISKKELS